MKLWQVPVLVNVYADTAGEALSECFLAAEALEHVEEIALVKVPDSVGRVKLLADDDENEIDDDGGEP